MSEAFGGVKPILKREERRYEREIVSLRRYLHRHPQLSGEKHGTSEKVQKELEKRGMERFAERLDLFAKAVSVQPSARTKKLRADVDS